MEWRVEARNALGLPREVVVRVQAGRVVVEPPPPTGGFSMTPDQADLLALAVSAASSIATGQA